MSHSKLATIAGAELRVTVVEVRLCLPLLLPVQKLGVALALELVLQAPGSLFRQDRCRYRQPWIEMATLPTRLRYFYRNPTGGLLGLAT